jgi:hypothetical protein
VFDGVGETVGVDVLVGVDVIVGVFVFVGEGVGVRVKVGGLPQWTVRVSVVPSPSSCLMKFRSLREVFPAA